MIIEKQEFIQEQINESVIYKSEQRHFNLSHTVQMMHKKPWGLLQWHLSPQNCRRRDDIQLWVRIAAATAMGIGTSIGGYKIIKTVGGKIMKIRPVNGVAADLSSAVIIFGATLIHLPVSTTHVISSAIMGVGSAQRVKGVNWGVAKKIVMTWVITLPISATIAAIVYQVLNLFF